MFYKKKTRVTKSNYTRRKGLEVSNKKKLIVDVKENIRTKHFLGEKNNSYIVMPKNIWKRYDRLVNKTIGKIDHQNPLLLLRIHSFT